MKMKRRMKRDKKRGNFKRTSYIIQMIVKKKEKKKVKIKKVKVILLLQKMFI
jgi:hypothetical protein